MKHVFIVDGHDSFSDARKAALHAPWSNGAVYRHPAGPGLQQADQGKLVFHCPRRALPQVSLPALDTHNRPLTPTTSLLESP